MPCWTAVCWLCQRTCVGEPCGCDTLSVRPRAPVPCNIVEARGAAMTVGDGKLPIHAFMRPAILSEDAKFSHKLSCCMEPASAVADLTHKQARLGKYLWTSLAASLSSRKLFSTRERAISPSPISFHSHDSSSRLRFSTKSGLLLTPTSRFLEGGSSLAIFLFPSSSLSCRHRCDNCPAASRHPLQLQVCLTADSKNRLCMSKVRSSATLVLAKEAVAQVNAYSGMQLGEMAESPEHAARSGRSISLRW